MVSDEGASVLSSRMDDTLATFGQDEGGAILEEVMARMIGGGSVTDWLEMIEAVESARHPYLRFAQHKVN